MAPVKKCLPCSCVTVTAHAAGMSAHVLTTDPLLLQSDKIAALLTFLEAPRQTRDSDLAAQVWVHFGSFVPRFSPWSSMYHNHTTAPWLNPAGCQEESRRKQETRAGGPGGLSHGDGLECGYGIGWCLTAIYALLICIDTQSKCGLGRKMGILSFRVPHAVFGVCRRMPKSRRPGPPRARAMRKPVHCPFR